MAHHRQGRLSQAIECYGLALKQDSRLVAAWTNMGVALRAQAKPAAAIACHKRALSHTPDDPGVLSNLGNALRECGRFDEARTALTHAIKLRPETAEYWNNLSLVFRDTNRHGEALALAERAMALKPDYPEAQWERALNLMTLGDYAQGFPAYEARWLLDRSPPRKLPMPLWKGEPLNGRSLFLHDEQGFGDAIMFARFIKDALARGAGSIVLECQPELKRLFSGIEGVSELVERGQKAPECDLFAPLLSLPGIMGLGSASLPGPVPYLKPPEKPTLVLPKDGRMKVGLVWAGKTTPRDRSVPLGDMLGFLGHPGVAGYGLQLGPRADDIAKEGAGALILDLSAYLKDFADTASVLAQLDLVLTIDTSAAHLAGALGKIAWVPLLYHSDWRWGATGEATPWYPSLRLFRQEKFDDWQAPFEKMEKAFRDLLAAALAARQKQAASPVSPPVSPPASGA